MKKIIVVFLTIALLLSMAACGNDGNGKVRIDEGKEADYQFATSCLDEFLYHGYFTSADGTVCILNDAAEQLYNLFFALGDYRDSEEIFSRFSVLEDQLLYTTVIYADENWQPLPGEEEDFDTLYYYNADGTVEVEYSIGESGVHVLYFLYDGNGNNTRTDSCVIYYDMSYGDFSIITTDLYEYDEYGTVVRQVHRSSDEIYWDASWTATYDAEGKILTRCVAGEDVNPDFNTDYYTYDEKGQLIQVEYAGGWTNTYEYDDAGNMTYDSFYHLIYENSRVVKKTYDDGRLWNCVYGTAYTFDSTGLLVRNDMGENDISDDLSYTLDENLGGYVITGIGSCKDKVLNIPKYIEEIPVVGIDDEAFEGNTNITALYLPTTIRYIGDSIVYKCTSLEILSFPFAVEMPGISQCDDIKEVYYGGSINQFKMINAYDIENEMVASDQSVTIHCKDGDLVCEGGRILSEICNSLLDAEN